MKLPLQVAGKTDVGCVRSNNEDAYGFDIERGVFVVCDGVGGLPAGEVASQMGVRTILDYFRGASENGTFPSFGPRFEGVTPQANALGSAIRMANEMILDAAAEDESCAGMSSTIVAGVVSESGVSIAHVGDSRVYLIRGQSIQQLTVDHSLVMEQVKRGLMTIDEAEFSGVQNFIVRALGAEPEVEPDVADIDTQPADVLLFTSDGLTRHVAESQIAEIVNSSSSLESACETLIEAAKRDGGSDNITCVLVRLGSRLPEVSS